jgi:hypothetical protein
MKYFARENSISVKDLEEAVLQWRLKSTAAKTTDTTSLNNQSVQPTIPPFMEQVSQTNVRCTNVSWAYVSQPNVN